MTDTDDRPAPAPPTNLRGEPGPQPTLRQRAEQIACDTAAQSPETLAALSPQDLQRTVHELRVHQIELEMQNEELRQAQAEIEVAHARYFDLYELAPVGYCTLCERGLIREANLAAATLLGLARGALTGQPMFRFILREDQHVFYRFRKTLFEAQASSAAEAGAASGPRVCTLRMRKPDGVIVWAQFAAIAVTEADGSPVCRVTISDLTLSKAVDALRDSEERLTLALDAAQLGIYDWDIAVNRILWSQQHERLWGFAPGGFDGTYEDFLSRVHPDDVPGVTEAHARCMATRERFSSDYRVIWPDGSLHWMQGLGEFSVDSTGKPQRMRGVVMEITARKEAEQALRRFQQIVETSREMVVFIGRDLRYQVVNPAYAALFLVTPQALQGCRVSEVVGADAYARIAPELHAALSGETRRFGVRITGPDGRGLDLEATCSPFREGGAVQGIVVSFHDVTETQAARAALEAERAELENLVVQRTAALQASEGMLRTIYDLLPVGISITDRSGRIVDCNQASERLLDLTREEHLQRHYVGKEWTIIRPDGTPLPADDYASVRAMVEQRPVHDVEMGIVKPAGITWLSVSATPTAHADYGVVIAYVDMTERRQGEAALRASEQRWRFALEGASDGVWDWDLPSSRVFFSKGWKAMLGYGDAEIEDRLDEWEERVHPEDLPRALADVQDHLDGKTPVYVNEHRMRCKDGSWKWILDRGQVMERGADGQPLRAIGVHSDISERKQTEAALRTGRQQLDMALHAAAMGIWDWEIATGRVAWAGEHAALFGIAAADFGGTIEDVRACVHPDDREQGMAAFQRTVEEGTDFDNTYRVVWSDGSLHWVHSLGQLIRDECGAPQRLVGTTQDVTTSKLAAETLERNQTMLARTEAIAHVGSWEWDLATDTVTWSAELFRILQRDLAEGAPSSADHAQLYFPEDMQRLSDAVDAALIQGTPYELELRAIRNDGATVVLISTLAISGRRGQLIQQAFPVPLGNNEGVRVCG
ncbi:PAS domain-containing protein [uncultured Lamprocystis sp.]|jgi:PAS domain S-box-containing protein|uniref:PAS domain-containing protein n=1 Tax=uncultured Lamprocystis sp. TaxID=543132 RepID=UPI0025FBB5C6|nr:PAS domain-containing protein [uncultured Lamprocystis sp.]